MNGKTVLASVMLFASAAAFAAEQAAPQSEHDFSKVPGVVIDHYPVASGNFVGSPTITILPDGTYVAMHDTFGKGGLSWVSPVFKSADKGLTWEKISELKQFGSTLFVHNGALYSIGVGYGGVYIKKSTDGGVTWSETKPEGKNGLILQEDKLLNFHSAPTPVIVAKGRIWRAMETTVKGYGWGQFGVFLLSAPVNSDLLDPESWTASQVKIFPEELSCAVMKGWLEGNAVERKSDGQILDILRVHSVCDDIAMYVEADKNGQKVKFDGGMFMRLPGACKKFTIRYDDKSKRYFAIVNYIPEDMRGKTKAPSFTFDSERARHTMALASSSDLTDWRVDKILLQTKNADHEGFQYVDWVFDGDDIIAVSRTSFFDGAAVPGKQHDANFFTFHRILNFRDNPTLK